MNQEELKTAVIDLIDSNCMSLTKAEYIELMEELADDFLTRADATKEELVAENDDCESPNSD